MLTTVGAVGGRQFQYETIISPDPSDGGCDKRHILASKGNGIMIPVKKMQAKKTRPTLDADKPSATLDR